MNCFLFSALHFAVLLLFLAVPVQAKAAGATASWICNARVSAGTLPPASHPTLTRTNGVSGVNNSKSIAATNGEWLNPEGFIVTNASGKKVSNEKGIGCVNAPGKAIGCKRDDPSEIGTAFAISNIVFGLKNHFFDAEYTIDLCTNDMGELKTLEGPPLTNFSAFLSATELADADFANYLEHAHLQVSIEVACGNGTTYSPNNLMFLDNLHVGSVVLGENIDFVTNNIQTPTNSISQQRAKFCVTRFVFRETSGFPANGQKERNQFLSGATFNISLTQSSI